MALGGPYPDGLTHIQYQPQGSHLERIEGYCALATATLTANFMVNPNDITPTDSAPEGAAPIMPQNVIPGQVIGQMLTADQLQTLLSNIQTLASNAGRANSSAGLSDYDGQPVVYRSVKAEIKELSPTANFDDRSAWIENIETSMQNDNSGIRWMATNQLLSCVPEGEPWSDDRARQRSFTINAVIPYHSILSCQSLSSCFFVTEDLSNPIQKYKVRVPTRITTELSRFIYNTLKPKIPEEQRQLHSEVNKGDGIALVKKVRSCPDSVTESPLDLLDNRKRPLKLASIDAWPVFKADLLKLVADWESR